jgi:MFS family permease
MDECNEDSSELSSFVVSVYLLGFCFGPLLMAPLSEIYGRLITYQVSNICFLAFLISCAVAPSLGSLVAFRFLCGFFGGTPVTNGGGTVADVVAPHQRGTGMSAFTMGTLLGSIVGPLAGGYLS